MTIVYLSEKAKRPLSYKNLDSNMLNRISERFLSNHVNEVFLFRKSMDIVSIVTGLGINPTVAD